MANASNDSIKVSSQGYIFIVRDGIIYGIRQINESQLTTRKSAKFQQRLNVRLSLLAENDVNSFVEVLEHIDIMKDNETKTALEHMNNVERKLPSHMRHFSNRVWDAIDQKLSE